MFKNMPFFLKKAIEKPSGTEVELELDEATTSSISKSDKGISRLSFSSGEIKAEGGQKLAEIERGKGG